MSLEDMNALGKRPIHRPESNYQPRAVKKATILDADINTIVDSVIEFLESKKFRNTHEDNILKSLTKADKNKNYIHYLLRELIEILKVVES